MAVKGASFAAFPDGQTVFGLGNGNLLQPMPIPETFGHAHAILVGADGLEAAADPRSDGAPVGF